MPAHVPRRSFAKPFIVTVAAVSAACHEPTVSDNPPSHNPPPQDTAVPSATTAPSASSAPIANDTPAAADQAWPLKRDDKNTCTAGTAPYACPTNVTRYPATIRLAKGETECKVTIYPEMGSCPPHAMCNPPPPHDVVVPCPK
jgi:hypothetical protein